MVLIEILPTSLRKVEVANKPFVDRFKSFFVRSFLPTSVCTSGKFFQRTIEFSIRASRLKIS